MNAAASAASSWAISSSIFAQTATARVAAAGMRSPEPGQLRRASSACWQIGLVEIQHEQQRLGRQELKAAQPLRRRRRRAGAARSGVPASSAARQRTSMSCSFFRSGAAAFFRSRSSRSSRRSTTPRSARMTSSSIVRTSRAGSTDARRRAATDGSRNIRTTCSSASALRNGATSRSACGAGLRAAGTGDVGELHRRRHPLAGVEERGQPIEPLVGHARDADVRVRLARRARRLASARQELEQGGLARRGKPMSPARSIREVLVAGRRHLVCAGPAAPNLHIVAQGSTLVVRPTNCFVAKKKRNSTPSTFCG